MISVSKSLDYLVTSPPQELISTSQSQLVEITYSETTHQFITQIEYEKNQINLVAISPEGLPLFDFSWSESSILSENRYVPLPTTLDVSRILVDIQLCHWPITQLESSLLGEGVSIKQTSSINNEVQGWNRTISQNNKVLFKINKTKQGYVLDNVFRKYHISITNLKQGSL